MRPLRRICGGCGADLLEGETHSGYSCSNRRTMDQHELTRQAQQARCPECDKNMGDWIVGHSPECSVGKRLYASMRSMGMRPELGTANAYGIGHQQIARCGYCGTNMEPPDVMHFVGCPLRPKRKGRIARLIEWLKERVPVD